MIAAGVVKVIKWPVSFGTAVIWQRLDVLRDARIVPYWTLNVSTKTFTGLTIMVWVICGAGVVWMAIDPQAVMSAMIAPFASGTFASDTLSRVSAFFDSIARAATPLLILTFTTLAIAVGIIAYEVLVLRKTESNPPKWLARLSQITLIPLALYFLWVYAGAFARDGITLISAIGPAFYQAFMAQIETFSVIDIVFVAFFGSFILTTAVLFMTCIWLFAITAAQQIKKWRAADAKPNLGPKPWINPAKVFLSLYVFGAGVLLSFLATATAARIGLSFDGTLDVTLTFQLLAVNAIFDGLTLAITLRLMSWAAEPLKIRAVRLRLRDHAETLKAVGTAHRLPQAANSPTSPRLRLNGDKSDDLFYSVSQRLIRDLLQWHRERRLVWPDAQLRGLRELEFASSSFAGLDERTNLHGDLFKIATANQEVLDQLEQRLRWRLPIALVIDVAAAFAFCLAVLWFGLFRTPAALDWSGIWWVAIGGFEGTAFTELGPLFWITHTTFIPTLLIWAALIVMVFLCSGVSRTVDRLIRLRPPTNVPAAALERIEQARMALIKTATVFGSLAASIYALDYSGLWFFGAP